MGRINVLHIYQNSKLGGIQLQLLNLFHSYDRELVNPTFCCLGPRLEVGAEFEREGFDFVALGRKRYSRFSPSIILDLTKLMREKNIHVLRTHKYRAGFYGRIAACLANVPVIISSEHNTYHEKEMRFSRRITNRLLFSVTDAYVGVSDAIRQDLIRYDRLPPERVLVIRNGVDLERFEPEIRHSDFRTELGIPQETLMLVSIGRLAENKGYEYLLESISMLQPSIGRDMRLVIVGEGSHHETIARSIRKRGLEGKVILAGQRMDMPDILAASDIFVMSSIEEGLPNAMLEAMSMARPIVATRVGGIPEVLHDPEHGRIVPPMNPKALADAIRDVALQPERARAMGRAARDYVLANLSIQATASKWESLYQTLLASKGITP